MMTSKIGGCVVFFNPDQHTVDNITTYYSKLSVLIIADNSPRQNTDLIKQISALGGNIIYKWMGENTGIAAALNAGCREALEHGCDWVLTMDQDSSFRTADIEGMINSIEPILASYANVGIIACNHKVHEKVSLKTYSLGNPKASGLQQYNEMRAALTSGNLLSMKAYAACGPFEEKLFIDHVDHEYCLRIRKNHFKVILANDIFLNHALGHLEPVSFLGRNIQLSNHNYQRRYYMTRNGFYIIRKYGRFDKVITLAIARNILFFDMIKVLFFEKDKWRKAKAIFAGMYHFLTGRYGMYKR